MIFLDKFKDKYKIKCVIKKIYVYPMIVNYVLIGVLLATKNLNDKTPRNFFKGSSKKFWFTCNVCNHNFYQSLNNITTSNMWCPFCSSKQLCDKDDCKICFEKSFASIDKSKCWNINLNDKSPREVFKNSGKKYHFICDICNHDLYLKLDPISSKNAWCEYCINQKICNKEDCKMCFEKSFANHEKSKYLDKNLNGNINLRNIFKCAHIKLFFKCDICEHSLKKCYIL